jgi:thiamine pyrophosphokinase
VGDCDSLNPEIFRKYSDRIFKDTEQETNDLTRAVRWCSETEITSSGLLYPLIERKPKNWREASLNEATGDHFELEFEGGEVIMFMLF